MEIKSCKELHCVCFQCLNLEDCEFTPCKGRIENEYCTGYDNCRAYIARKGDPTYANKSR